MRTINKYKDRLSIRMINQHVLPNVDVFQFSHVIPTEVMRQIDWLDTTKSNSGCIPARALKAMKEMVCPCLTDCIKFNTL